MRERLIELCENLILYCKSSLCADCEHNNIDYPHCMGVHFADHLLTNGVIVPPCKAGAKVYFAGLESGVCLIGDLVSYSLDAAHLWFNCHYDCGLNYWHPIEDFGKTVFLTREEAEKALKECEK